MERVSRNLGQTYIVKADLGYLCPTWHAASLDAPDEVLGHVVVDDDAALRLQNHVQRLQREGQHRRVRILQYNSIKIQLSPNTI